MKEVVDVRGDGNCFYRALYGYVVHNKNLHFKNMGEFLSIFQCDQKHILQQNVSKMDHHFASDKGIKRLYNRGQEDLWEECVRHYLANLVLQNPMILREHLDIIYNNYPESYAELKTIFTDWFGKAFPTQPPANVVDYAKEFAKNVRISRTEACEIDIFVIQKILAQYGIQLKVTPIRSSDYATISELIINSNKLIPKSPVINTIYLIRVPGHYNFVKFKDDDGSSSPRALSTTHRQISPRASSSSIHGMLVGGTTSKIMWTNDKIYKKFYDKKKGKYYIRKNNKKIYI